MIIGRGEGKRGKELLLLGLSNENIRRLVQDKPISITRESHGDAIPDDLHIIIMFGSTEDEMRRKLTDAQAIDDTTQVFRDPRLG